MDGSEPTVTLIILGKLNGSFKEDMNMEKRLV